MAPVDTKQRYSLYVPKPLARLNLGDWQRRDLQSPKFGYAGVSIQTDSNLFVDVTKGTHIQAKGGYVVQTTDWLQTSKNAMYIATSDNATVGADGTIVMAAGAGHGPTFTLDHGDSMDTFPYNPLNLHYRVEEVQNSLFDFFRGKRKKHEQKPLVKTLTSWWFKRDDKIFNSSKNKFSNPLAAFGENPMGYEGAEEAEDKADLRGGFERVANVSWQRLYGKDNWDIDKLDKKVAPYDIFDNLGDVRADIPKDLKPADLKDEARDNTGALTEKQLVYGFSTYFSRFDPYQMIDPDRFAADVIKKKLSLFEAGILKVFAHVNNALVKLRRTLDVVYKIGSILKDNSLSKLLTDAAAAVDAMNASVKAFRGQYEQLIENPYITHKSGTFYDQMLDEEASGHQARAAKLEKQGKNWGAPSTAQATVRSGSTGKDFGVFGDKASFADGDTMTIKADDGTLFTTPALSLGAQAATAAVLSGGPLSEGKIEIPDGAWIQVQINGGAYMKIDLPKQTILSLRECQDCDKALLQGQAVHFVNDRNNAIAALQNAIAAAIGAPAAVSNGILTITSPTTGSSSKIQLFENPTETLASLGFYTASATGTAATPVKAAKDITSADIVALLARATSNPAKSVFSYFTFSVEGDQVVITRTKKGDGSEVTVGGSLASKLKFVGDARGWSDHDKIEDLDPFRRGQDDFEKAMIEVQQLPQDTANLMRPMIAVWKGAVGAVNKLNSAVKGILKVGALKLPSNKGAIGLVANSGISLGTPDRIVGAGGQGIVFIADGGTGKPDHAKYALLEDIINRFAGADIAGAIRELILGTEPAPTKASLGFRVFSDTTVDLTARKTAHLLAMGREDRGGKIVGSGIARVAGSRGVEIAGHDKVTVGARDKDDGRVEVVGRTVALGFTKMDADTQQFGIQWNEELHESHPETSSVLVHSTDQACIVVGKYMVQLRTKDGTKKQAQAEQDQAEKARDGFRAKLLKLQGDESEAVLANEPADAIDEIKKQIKDVKAELAAATKTLKHKQGVVKQSQRSNDEGVIISMRDPDLADNTSQSNWAWKAKPSIVLSEKGVTIATKTGKDDEDSSANVRITLNDEGLDIKVGQKTGIGIAKGKVQISDGSGKYAKLKDGEFSSVARDINFSAAQKITLG